MKTLAPMLLCVLAACGMASTAQGPRGERADTRLTQALAGKSAAPAQRCLARIRTNDLEIVDRGTILFKNGRGLVYRNDPEGGCPGLDPTRTIVTTSLGGDLCRNDTVRVVDRTSGSVVGACALSDFVPYAAPGVRIPAG